MMRTTRWILSVLTAVLLCIASMFAAFAEEQAATLDLPVSVRFVDVKTGTTPSAEFTLTATNDGPMPKGADSGTYRFIIQGDGKVILHFAFPEPGAWTYTLTGKSSAGTVAPERMYLTIRAFEENGVLTTVVVAEQEDGKKCDLLFTVNGTSPGPTPPTPQTGDDSHLALYAVLAGVSLTLIAGLIVYLFLCVKRRKRNTQ